MQNGFLRFIKEWVIPIGVTLVIVLLVRTYLFTLVRVSGPSMMPNLQDKEFVILSKISKYKRGDVIVFDARQEDPRFNSNDKDYVKRIIGVPGDTVSDRKSVV